MLKAKVPSTLLYAIESIPVNDWSFLERIEGQLLRKLCTFNTLVPSAAIRLEFGLISTYIQGIARVLLWRYQLNNSEIYSLRGFMCKELFGELGGKYSLYRDFSLALKMFGVQEESVISLLLIELKSFIKKSSGEISFNRYIEFCNTKERLKLIARTTSPKLPQKYITWNLDHEIRRWISLFRLNLLPLNDLTAHWFQNWMNGKNCNFCDLSIQNLDHVLFVCLALAFYRRLWLRPMFLQNGVKDVVSARNFLFNPKNEAVCVKLLNFFKEFIYIF